MKFGPVPTAEATGAILAHSLEVVCKPYDRQLTHRLRKGTCLSDSDVADLLEDGHATVVVARLEPSDVDEDTAAAQLAASIVPDPAAVGLRLSPATTGRVNVFATGAGVAVIDVEKIKQINAIDPMITVATVPAFHRMAAEGMVATIKIIAYAVSESALAQANAIGAALSLSAPQYASATLIETTYSPHVAVPDKGRRVTQSRLSRFGLMLSDRVVVSHDAQMIAAAITSAPGEIVLILTESATSDPLDVAPQAVRIAGGQVDRFGMPVDPGNLLFIGQVGDRPVIGLPGCARSPVLNGADWIVERTICGIPVTGDDIAGMGVGGLLKESPARHHPRRKAPE